MFVEKHQSTMQLSHLEEEIEKIKRNTGSYFKPWFKMKVVDTVKKNSFGLFSLLDICEDNFADIKEGDRFRIINL